MDWMGCVRHNRFMIGAAPRTRRKGKLHCINGFDTVILLYTA